MDDYRQYGWHSTNPEPDFDTLDTLYKQVNITLKDDPNYSLIRVYFKFINTNLKLYIHLYSHIDLAWILVEDYLPKPECIKPCGDPVRNYVNRVYNCIHSMRLRAKAE